MNDIKLNCLHRFSVPTLADSMIIEFTHYNGELFCLIRVKLELNVDPLHLEYYYIDVLVNITTNNKVCISDKTISPELYYYFGVLSSIKTEGSPGIDAYE